jgi:AGCS family alanine or glycine:cation symporter
MPILDSVLDGAAAIDRLLWGPWTVVFIAAVAVYLTVRSRGFQFRAGGLIARHTLGRMRKAAKSPRGMTPFQATATALASTVGMGNIAGVATALSLGGPGAVFWMWLLALLGMITKTAEITLAVHYRETDPQGRLCGGPMYYIRKGLGWPALARLFSAGVLVNAVFTASLLQSHTVGRAFHASYAFDPYLVTGLMGVTTAVVVIGGVRRIGWFCERLVPLMSLLYLLGGLVVFAVNHAAIPEVFALIVRHAFAPVPAAGGFAGATVAAAVKNGVARGMLSNEAGLGTAPMVHARSDTAHPFRQGMWGAVEVFVDTIVICTITAFAVVSTGALASGESGIELVIVAFSTVLEPGLASGLISVCILTFCLTTQIGFFIYYETAIVDLLGRPALKPLRWLYFLPAIAFAGVADVDRVWVFANIAVGVCAIPNLVALLALSGAFFALKRDYFETRWRYGTEGVERTGELVRVADAASGRDGRKR